MVAYAKRIGLTTHRAASDKVVNEKYELRSLLYRIGLSGKENKEVRKILLAPLTGDSAWKTPPLINTNQEM